MVAKVAVAVAIVFGFDLTVTVCTPPKYPEPAEARLTVPI